LPYERTVVKLYYRRGGRVVDGSGLENRHTRKGIRGSNPFLSASKSSLQRNCAALSLEIRERCPRDTSSANRTAENGLLGRDDHHDSAFLRRAHMQSGFGVPWQARGNFLVHLPEGTTRRSSGRVWRKVPDDILSYLGVGLNLSAWRSSATAGSLHRSVLFR
jgi:hypothetical protein